MIRRPPRSTRTTHSFPTRRSSDLVSANELQLVKTEVAPTSSVHPFRAADLSIHYKLHATLAVVRPQNSRRADNAACSRPQRRAVPALVPGLSAAFGRSEEHTSELQSLMRISYAVFCLKKKTTSRKVNI